MSWEVRGLQDVGGGDVLGWFVVAWVVESGVALRLPAALQDAAATRAHSESLLPTNPNSPMLDVAAKLDELILALRR